MMHSSFKCCTPIHLELYKFPFIDRVPQTILFRIQLVRDAQKTVAKVVDGYRYTTPMDSRRAYRRIPAPGALYMTTAIPKLPWQCTLSMEDVVEDLVQTFNKEAVRRFCYVEYRRHQQTGSSFNSCDNIFP